ncbi:MAG: PilZ domain-containing protein [Pseudomonadota bacterium]
MSSEDVVERRGSPRFDSEGLLVKIRKQGGFARLQGIARDFNRHGAGIIIDQPIGSDTVVYVSLACGDLSLDSVLAVVHNCCAIEDGFRCGVRFRAQSGRQANPAEVEAVLVALEARFASLKEAS